MANITPEDRLAYALELSRQLQAQLNLAWHGVTAVFTQYIIKLGLVLLEMRRLAKELNLPWEKWAATHLSHIPERTRQDYMQLASRPDAFNFAFLGKERLLHLIRVTTPRKGDDRIGDFLKKYEIPFDPKATSGDEKLVNFRNALDAAIAVERADKFGVSLSLTKVRTLLDMGGKVDNKVIGNMALLQKNDGNVENYLDTLIKNQGVEESPFEGEGRIESLVKLTARFKATVEAIMEKPSLKVAINPDEILEMEQLVKRLKEYMQAT
jgi:hypothetical protein